MTSFEIPGLPEGVVAIRVGAAEPGEYVYDLGQIRGPRGAVEAEQRIKLRGLIVAPAPGYEFAWDEARTQNVPVRRYASPKLLMAGFSVLDTWQEARVRAAVEQLPGFTAISPEP